MTSARRGLQVATTAFNRELTASTLGITPAVYAEVVRRTLMMISGAELCDDCKCGLDGFNLFAAGACCDAAPKPTNNTSGIIRCGCNRNN